MDNESVKRNILKLREQMNLSQQEIAERIGISRNAYRAIEKGTTKLFSDNLSRLAEISGKSEEELLLGYLPRPEQASALEDMQVSYNRQKMEIIRDYEDRLAAKDKEIAMKDSIIDSQETTIRTLKEMNSMLLRKSERNND